jgi:hypothetical protein
MLGIGAFTFQVLVAKPDIDIRQSLSHKNYLLEKQPPRESATAAVEIDDY